MSKEEEAGTVLVRPLKTFRGEPGEGRGPDGLVMACQEPFRAARARFAELKANGLVEEAKESKAEPAPQDDPPLAPQAPQADDKGRPRRG